MAKYVRRPTRAKGVEINRRIANDPDNPEWTAVDSARAKPAKDVLPVRLYQAAGKLPNRLTKKAGLFAVHFLRSRAAILPLA